MSLVGILLGRGAPCNVRVHHDEVGLCFSFSKALKARLSAATSFASETLRTFQPYAIKRVGISSEIAQDVFPSIVIWLLSQIQQRLSNFRCPAKDAASAEQPSIKQPSPASA